MRFNALASSGLAVLAAAFTLTACSGSTPSGSAGSAAASAPAASASAAASVAPDSAAARTGTFKGANGKHVAGTVMISGGKVMLSGFSSDAGPDLHIYLTDGAGESDVSSGKQLGNVAYDQASQTFSVAGVDPSKYSTVVIHCDKAKAVFGDASLS